MKFLILFLVLLLTLTTVSAYEVCYQEAYDVPNQTGIDTQNCGLRYGGIDNHTGQVSYFYYEKPEGAFNATWLLKQGLVSGITGNFSINIPQNCWNYAQDRLYLSVLSIRTAGLDRRTMAFCYDGTGYQQLVRTDDGPSGCDQYTAGANYSLIKDGNWGSYGADSTYQGSNNDWTMGNAGCGSVNAWVYEEAMVWDVCIPSWSCSEYGECNNHVLECIAVTDANNCGLTYPGNLSDFNDGCVASSTYRQPQQETQTETIVVNPQTEPPKKETVFEIFTSYLNSPTRTTTAGGGTGMTILNLAREPFSTPQKASISVIALFIGIIGIIYVSRAFKRRK